MGFHLSSSPSSPSQLWKESGAYFLLGEQGELLKNLVRKLPWLPALQPLSYGTKGTRKTIIHSFSASRTPLVCPQVLSFALNIRLFSVTFSTPPSSNWIFACQKDIADSLCECEFPSSNQKQTSLWGGALILTQAKLYNWWKNKYIWINSFYQNGDHGIIKKTRRAWARKALPVALDRNGEPDIILASLNAHQILSGDTAACSQV